MKLHDFILNVVWEWPSLNYKSSFDGISRSVLGHLFQVIGSGVDFNAKNGTFAFGKDQLDKTKKQRIERFEKICRITEPTERLFDCVLPCQTGERTDRNEFFDDFLKQNLPYYTFGQKVTEEEYDPSRLIVQIYPKEETDPDNYSWHPYPFSLEYCPFWNRREKTFIPKDKIKTDWREGIVWIFEEAKQWFEDDEKWTNDHYYNWARWDSRAFAQPNGVFFANWNKHEDKLKVCDDYEIPRKLYSTPEEMAADICKFRRQKYIDDCNQVINFYK